MRAVGAVHAHTVLHVLVGDGEEAELADEVSDFVITPCLLHPPDGLSQSVGTTPCCNVYRTGIVFISQTNQQFAARRVIALADGLDAAIHTAHDGTTRDVLCTGPIAKFLLAVLFLQRQKPLLTGASHEVRHVFGIGRNYARQILLPLQRVGVAVPAYARDKRLDLETIGIRHQSHHRLHVVGLHVGWRNVRTYH